ncbi:MAG: BPL-N domain-containing protein [Candidatus Thorarchaeota archaeon]
MSYGSRNRIGAIALVIAAVVVTGVIFSANLGIFNPNTTDPTSTTTTDSTSTTTTTTTPINLMDGAKVAIYTDHGVRASSRIALQHMFEWMGAEVTIINSTWIAEGNLVLYDMVVMPGGCWCDTYIDILDYKMDIIRQFVEDGGAYFGIDGGASYATSWRLDLFHGMFWPDANGSGDYLLEFNVNKDSTGPDLSEEPDSYSMFYEASGYFEVGNLTGIIPICTYTDTGLPSMIAFEYGNGSVFLSSPHPEYEEGNDRDGVEVWDTLQDPDSEWDFMKKICQWLLQEAGP